MDYLTRDPLSVAGANPFLGFLSNLGVLGWCAGAAICFFASGCLARRPHRAAESRFLLVAGLITTCLMADDLWVLHEQIGNSLPAIGDKTVQALYGIVVALLLGTFRRVISTTNWPVLLLALTWLGGAWVLDDFPYV